MGNFAVMNRIQEDNVKWNREKRKMIASFFFDISKLFIGGWVIGSSVPVLTDDYSESIWYLIPAGLSASIASAFIGKIILK